MYTVYKTVCLVNRKFYIGVHKTDNPDDDYIGSGSVLRRAIRKYGRENFRKEVLFVFETPEDAFAKEQELVTLAVVESKETYNLKLGGYGGFDLINRNGLTSGRKHRASNLTRDERRRGATETNRRYREDSEFRERANKARMENLKLANGITAHTDDAKRKIGIANSISQSGHRNSQYGTKWMFHPEFGDRKVKPAEVEDLLASGWNFGRLVKVA